jgi:hypothetical protein
VSFGTTTLVQLHGKGLKERTVSLWPQTAKVLTRWFQILNTDDKGFAFPTVNRTRSSAEMLSATSVVLPCVSSRVCGGPPFLSGVQAKAPRYSELPDRLFRAQEPAQSGRAGRHFAARFDNGQLPFL